MSERMEDGSGLSDESVPWCLRSIVRILQNGDPQASEEKNFKSSIVYVGMDDEGINLAGSAICTVEEAGRGSCIVSLHFKGAVMDGTNARVEIFRENFSHRALCDEPTAVPAVIVVDKK